MSQTIAACLLFALTGINPAFSANTDTGSTAAVNKECHSERSLVVVRAGDFPALLGNPISRIALWHVQGEQLVPIVSQIDRRDDEGRYRLENNSSDTEGSSPQLSADDEIVFRLADAGARRPNPSPASWPEILADISIINPVREQTQWVYATLATAEVEHISTPHLVDYQAQSDTVLTDQYKITFNDKLPFLIDNFNWHLGDQQGYSPNVLDTIKIKHTGTMFGFIPFERTADDYSSDLTQVKVGPLRVIRRTENRVRILWYMQTPSIYIDYVMMPDSFIMDTIIDIPFRLGLVFDEVETLTTIDWRNDPALPRLEISSPASAKTLSVTGQMSADKRDFNSINATRFSIQSDFGTASVQLDIPDDFPITPWLYLNDDTSVLSAPEHQPGQFGNVGFRTTGWENIDTDVHHLKFTTCLSSGSPSHVP